MAKVVQQVPKTYGMKALQDYMKAFFAHTQQRKEAIETERALQDRPKFPSARVDGRYALSNHLFTDGLRANLIAFDVRRWRQSAKFKTMILDIDKPFGMQSSIAEVMGEDYEGAVVIGVDPGEIITA
ncbi:hypothetical protein BC939DRAFT_505335 [Gamsiella multidivaricata]|uniref:uncharacterized protein n=1 Tax=Gamsiella multidivaricata TaxID=101098 RepID=UPI00222004BD|nr:uncharacterized protein BC939DRAFT_505335 [Gamsiella multidivaricata]KAI7820073.1 hypothetical protein BC939DRAFT_505335 [Gamsiella multidivaricata]